MEASLTFAARAVPLSLDDLLDDREMGGLLTEIQMVQPDALSYDQVARSPADRPIVGACVAKFGDRISASLGGYGPRPVLIASREAPEAVEKLAASAYEEAQDQWASGEYRSSVAGHLMRRLIREVMS